VPTTGGGLSAAPLGGSLANRKATMKLHIVSEGTGRTTKIFTESGEDISRYVHSVKIEINAHDVAIATVEMVNLAIDISALAKFRTTKRAANGYHRLLAWASEFKNNLLGLLYDIIRRR
jgi:hypothetical protein